MIKQFVVYFFILFSAIIKSQNFGALPYLGNGLSPYYMERIVTDSIHNKLILSSKFINKAGNKVVRGVWSWDGSIWDSLKGGLNTHDIPFNPNQPNGNILCGINYNGKFLVGGGFLSVGGVNANALATWDGTKWDSLPKRAFRNLDYQGSVETLFKYNNKLFIGGSFDSIQGQPALGIATYDGLSFLSAQAPIYSLGGITDMKIFNGDLYVSGVFTYSGQPGNRHIIKYNGTSWSSVGGGVQGSISSISSMAVYNNELYVGGYFKKADGNVGEVLMKWDGSNWKDAGWGNMYNNGNIWKLLVYKGKLYAFGNFSFTVDQPASKVAAFDGSSWCSYSDTINGAIYSADIYRDTIYIAGTFANINSDTAKKLVAKLVTYNNFNNCINIGIKEITENSTIKIYPNPASDILTIKSEENDFENSLIEITNPLGQVVLKAVYSGNVNVSDIPKGLYFLQIETPDKRKLKTKFIKK